MKRQVWCELLEHRELLAPDVIRQLRENDVEPIIAVRPWHLTTVLDLCNSLGKQGVKVSLWPMLGNARGRWASTSTADAYVLFSNEIVDAVCRCRNVNEIVFDLEPPYDVVQRLSHHSVPLRWLNDTWRGDAFERTRDVFAHSVRRTHRAGLGVGCAVVPLVLHDGSTERFARIFGCPVDQIEWDHHYIMLYRSVLRGYLPRPARAAVDGLIWEWLHRAKKRWPNTVVASIGATGLGALGDESAYTSPDELLRDMSLIKHTGLSHVALFELSGLLRQSSPEVWWQAFLCPESPRVEVPRSPLWPVVVRCLDVVGSCDSAFK